MTAVQTFDIPAGPLDATLTGIARRSGQIISIQPGLVDGLTAPPIQGKLSTEQAYRRALEHSGLELFNNSSGALTLRRMPAADVTTLPAVTISAERDPGALPPVYAGGQVAAGGKVGILGNKDAMDTPFNTASYTSQLILDQQARSITDVLSNNPFVRLTFPDNDSATDLIVRGNRVSSLDMGYDGLYGIGNVGIESLERVEFLSGANALLNGLGAIGGPGGMVNQVPKKALEKPLTRITGTYVSSSQFGAQVDVSRRFGDDKQLGIRFNGAYSDGDAETRFQSKQVKTGTVALDYRTDDVRLSANFGTRRNDAESPARTLFVSPGFNIPAPPHDAKATWQQPWSHDIADNTFGMVRGEYDITPDVTAYAAIGGSRYKEDEFFSNSQVDNADGDIRQLAVYWPIYRNSVSAETGIRGKSTTGPVTHNWTLSASALRNTSGNVQNKLSLISSNIYNPAYISPPSINGYPGPGSIPKTGATDLSGVAVADTLGFLNDRVLLTLGVRQQNVDARSYNALTGAQTGPSADKGAVTYAAGLVVKPAPNLSLYGNYIEGLQAGPVAPAQTINANQVFSPFISKQYEAGVKYDFGKFLTTVSVYQLTTPNSQTVPLTPTTSIFNVDGEQRTQGIELNAYGELVPGVRLLGGAAFVDARQTRTAGGGNDGKKVTGASDITANLGVEWDPRFLQGLTLSGRGIYTGKQYVDNANLQSIPSWVRYDIGARYKTSFSGHATTFRFGVENVFNKSYWAEAVQGYLVQSRPRTFLLSASIDM